MTNPCLDAEAQEVCVCWVCVEELRKLGMLSVIGLMRVGTGLPCLCWEFHAASDPLLCDSGQVAPIF